MALTVRLTKKDENLIEKLKKHFDEPRASQALLKAADTVINQLIPLQNERNLLFSSYLKSQEQYRELIELLKQRKEIEQQIENAIITGVISDPDQLDPDDK